MLSNIVAKYCLLPNIVCCQILYVVKYCGLITYCRKWPGTRPRSTLRIGNCHGIPGLSFPPSIRPCDISRSVNELLVVYVLVGGHSEDGTCLMVQSREDDSCLTVP